VNAAGKKYSTTGPWRSAFDSENVIGLPASAACNWKSGALAPSGKAANAWDAEHARMIAACARCVPSRVIVNSLGKLVNDLLIVIPPVRCWHRKSCGPR
jgi:hypothetical protein